MKKSEFLLLADKFLNGTLSDHEHALFHAQCDMLENRIQEWDAASMGEQEAVKQQIFEGITGAIRDKEKQPPLMKLGWKWMVAAAILFIAAFLAFSLKDRIYNQLFPVKVISIEARKNKAVRTRLPDGTNVWLNAESSLSFPDEFRDSLRSVTLTGEAYFDVAHDAAKPFQIHSQNLITRVLGTRFVVKSYSNDARSKITVLEGKVRVSTQGNKSNAPVVLRPKQQLTTDKLTGEMAVVDGIDSLSAMAWASGKLLYGNAPLTDVIEDLERRYNVHISAEKHLEACLIYADVLPGDSLTDVLELLSVSLNGKIEMTAQSTFRISGKGCK